MNYIENNVGIPKIPQSSAKAARIDPPKPNQKALYSKTYEHSWELIFDLLVQGIRSLPKMIMFFIIPLAIVTVLNIVLASIPTWQLYGFTKAVVVFLIFITASYNSIIPRTIFWTIILTIGRKMFTRIRREGFSKTLADFKQLPVNVKAAIEALGSRYISLWVGCAGLGFIMANFLSRNNRIDKSLIAIVLAISIADTLTKGNKSTLFTAIKLIHKDLVGIVKGKSVFTDNHVYIASVGFISGLLGNLLFAVITLDFGGYILGAVLAVAGIVIAFTNKNEVQSD